MGDKRRIGFIGLGIMGGRMAATLLRAGHALNVLDIDQSKMDALKTLGASTCASPRKWPKRAVFYFSVFPSP